MGREDAELALARHATSRIRDPADLIGVATFGFRGEALPAIASVARFELETSPDGRAGTRIGVVGGKRDAVADAVRQRGTTVTVRALFFNTPARRKFLRAQATETRAVVEVLTVLALTRPDVAFTLTSDDRALIDVPPAAGQTDRVRALWGAELADTLLPVAHCAGPLEVRGFAQRPAQARPAGRKGYVFVRGRPIRDPFILRAAEAGYRSTIAPGDRPSLLLFLELPGDAVDVNVHPAKLEVRFRDKFFVERVVEEGVRRALTPLGAAAPLAAGSGAWPSSAWAGGPVELPQAPRAGRHRPAPAAAPARRLRDRALFGAHGCDPHRAQPSSTVRRRAMPAGARGGPGRGTLRGVGEPAGALRRDVRLPRGDQGGPAARAGRDARAHRAAPDGDPAGARRSWTPHDP